MAERKNGAGSVSYLTPEAPSGRETTTAHLEMRQGGTEGY